MEYILIAVVIAVVLVGAAAGLVVSGKRRKELPPVRQPEPPIEAPAAQAPAVGAPVEPEAEQPSAEVAEPAAQPAAEPQLELDVPEPTAGRLVRLRSRLSRSQNSMGKGLLALLSRDHLDEDAWEEIEELLLTADVGVAPR
jgi:fused signal recognition particle receptor